ncbi:MAG: TIGR00289 family protein, partial [Candidatus Aenigmarchaeota archaeon]|nr:TIGR00289 family protein [Candidatus Aenigmarchaeota archaeon]
LFSGGKDSVFAILKAKQKGHEIKYLATIHSKNPDSYMYHTPNIGLTLIQAEAMKIQLASKESKGEKEKEIEDLKILLEGLGVEGVVCGAIASNYQKQRVEKVCKELNLKLLSPLWEMDQEKLLRDIIENKFEVIITAVAAEGFDESWLGRKIDEECIKDLIELKEKFSINIAGEGGEFETVVLDCPLFIRKILITESEKRWEGNNGMLDVKDAKLVEK